VAARGGGLAGCTRGIGPGAGGGETATSACALGAPAGSAYTLRLSPRAGSSSSAWRASCPARPSSAALASNPRITMALIRWTRPSGTRVVRTVFSSGRACPATTTLRTRSTVCRVSPSASVAVTCTLTRSAPSHGVSTASARRTRSCSSARRCDWAASGTAPPSRTPRGSSTCTSARFRRGTLAATSVWIVETCPASSRAPGRSRTSTAAVAGGASRRNGETLGRARWTRASSTVSSFWIERARSISSARW